MRRRRNCNVCGLFVKCATSQSVWPKQMKGDLLHEVGYYFYQPYSSVPNGTHAS